MSHREDSIRYWLSGYGGGKTLAAKIVSQDVLDKAFRDLMNAPNPWLEHVKKTEGKTYMKRVKILDGDNQFCIMEFWGDMQGIDGKKSMHEIDKLIHESCASAHFEAIGRVMRFIEDNGGEPYAHFEGVPGGLLTALQGQCIDLNALTIGDIYNHHIQLPREVEFICTKHPLRYELTLNQALNKVEAHWQSAEITLEQFNAFTNWIHQRASEISNENNNSGKSPF